MLALVEDRTAGDPVPVLFPLASWDPTAVDLRAWMERKLVQDHAELGAAAPGEYGDATLAGMLLERRRVLPVLDGFDELPPRDGRVGAAPDRRGIAVRLRSGAVQPPGRVPGGAPAPDGGARAADGDGGDSPRTAGRRRRGRLSPARRGRPWCAGGDAVGAGGGGAGDGRAGGAGARQPADGVAGQDRVQPPAGGGRGRTAGSRRAVAVPGAQGGGAPSARCLRRCRVPAAPGAPVSVDPRPGPARAAVPGAAHGAGRGRGGRGGVVEAGPGRAGCPASGTGRCAAGRPGLAGRRRDHGGDPAVRTAGAVADPVGGAGRTRGGGGRDLRRACGRPRGGHGHHAAVRGGGRSRRTRRACPAPPGRRWFAGARRSDHLRIRLRQQDRRTAARRLGLAAPGDGMRGRDLLRTLLRQRLRNRQRPALRPDGGGRRQGRRRCGPRLPRGPGALALEPAGREPGTAGRAAAGRQHPDRGPARGRPLGRGCPDVHRARRSRCGGLGGTAGGRGVRGGLPAGERPADGAGRPRRLRRGPRPPGQRPAHARHLCADGGGARRRGDRHPGLVRHRLGLDGRVGRGRHRGPALGLRRRAGPLAADRAGHRHPPVGLEPVRGGPRLPRPAREGALRPHGLPGRRPRASRRAPPHRRRLPVPPYRVAAPPGRP
ncbi:hypothetical protein [Streptomyces sp. NBC_00299]|uniref:hypothetical protein n=1 Tax=Streptomyces sp. NBC_00299 TaxID=2975705 RepID=UPI003FA7DC29